MSVIAGDTWILVECEDGNGFFHLDLESGYLEQHVDYDELEPYNSERVFDTLDEAIEHVQKSLKDTFDIMCIDNEGFPNLVKNGIYLARRTGNSEVYKLVFGESLEGLDLTEVNLYEGMEVPKKLFKEVFKEETLNLKFTAEEMENLSKYAKKERLPVNKFIIRLLNKFLEENKTEL